MGDQQQVQIPGYEVIHLDEYESLHDFGMTSKQLHGNNTAKAVADKSDGGMAHCENKMPADLNKVFDREIGQGWAFPVTRPGRPVNGIVVSEGGVTGSEGIFIAYPTVEKDKRRSGTAFFMCARQGALTRRWKSSTRPARGRVSQTARVSWATANLEEAEGKALT
jgi:hypothetical protein